MSEPTHKTYALTTLADIWDQVPADRMDLCFAELGKCFQTAKAYEDLLFSLAVDLAKAKGKDLSSVPRCKMPMPIKWVDDGKGVLGADFVTVTGDPLTSFRITKETQPPAKS